MRLTLDKVKELYAQRPDIKPGLGENGQNLMVNANVTSSCAMPLLFEINEPEAVKAFREGNAAPVRELSARLGIKTSYLVGWASVLRPHLGLPVEGDKDFREGQEDCRAFVEWVKEQT